ncbi:MAG: methionyl-tRNA formyltransferase [Patescibacteria group bacterium]
MQLQVVFFGTSEIGIPTLLALVENKKINLLTVITQPDQKAGRKGEITSPEVKIFAEQKNIPVLQPENLKGNEAFEQFLKNLKPDLFIVFSYGKILPPAILAIPKFGAVNIHTSLLPKFRGASPIQEALLQGEKQTGITMIKMNEKMDEGDIIFVKKMPIEENDDYISLEERLSILSGILIDPLIQDYTQGILKPLKQKNENATYCSKRTKEDGKIDWEKENAQEVERKMKAFKKWPGIFTMWNGKRIKIQDGSTEESQPGKPGSLSFTEKNIMKIACKKGSFIPKKLQMEGKKEMGIEEFLRGYEKALKENPKFE